MSIHISQLKAGDTIAISFVMGYAPQLLAKNRAEVIRYKNNKPRFMTRAVGRVQGVDLANKTISLILTDPDLALDQFHRSQEVQNPVGLVEVSYKYIKRLEQIVPTNFTDPIYYANPGQEGLGAGRIRASLAKIAVVF